MPRLSAAALPLLLLTATAAHAQVPAATRAADSAYVRDHYLKLDRRIPMRDGVQLYTVIYVPKDAAKGREYPILMRRTPYSAGPYGEGNYPQAGPGQSRELTQEGYIFVSQDVRGRYMSEGQFEEMTPTVPAAHGKAKKGKTAPHDESTDTYDTIEWLLKNVPHHNGRVGLMGISYPGFYASAALPDAHPALKAVSPQAPVTDEFMGDDANHQGAFFLLDNFDFMQSFDAPHPGPQAKYTPLFSAEFADAYRFFLDLGPINNANGPTYYNGRAKTWNEYLAHPTYDAYWQARNIRPHLKHVKPATLVVGGWYDAEDLFGALNTYRAIEQQSPGAQNRLVMGPWTHGAWARPEWSRFGPLGFGQNTAQWYRQNLELPFFNYYLKGKGSFNASEATVFNTGTAQWEQHAAWPPNTSATPCMLQAGGALRPDKPGASGGFDEYVSDPQRPVPYTNGVRAERNNEYMVEDQRFAAQRPDVLVYQTEPLPADVTVAGPIPVKLFVSTSGTDADFVVKIIDVLPDSARGVAPGVTPAPRAGYQQLVRAEVFRGRFRNSFEKPEAFQPGQVAEVRYQLPDVLHTFKKGHRLMVQVQSSWFPLVDRNPQTFVPIPTAGAADFQKATIRLYHDAEHASGVWLPVLPQ
ncbi:CocE/NonD family hydrolase [Hymenobacter sp. 15J16-1T3B]|uniref:CocE/NonD family hydrolase n=1 Tax=Hymenobacter sp. 15J16-1T3B TaxID=2886941 RepID=UPI001D0F64CE|nr:CocE/NonD family hydrolase [Hymenobacter sp. 15J16-1T3B]MCC3159872.1 CocE/NonD family hydrolase [Hymenobacter sp. 15J16-1T3B]